MSTGLAAYATIIVALLTLLGGFFTYSFQRRTDRRNQLIEIRRTAYRAYLAALMDQINAPTGESLNHLLKCKFELFAVASDATIRKIGEFSNYMIATSYSNSSKRDHALHKRQLAEVLLAMRNDCFEKTRLSIEEASQLLPMQ
jgi:hypothetical protein